VAQSIIDSLGAGSAAAYALRFAASFDGVEMVLSGVSNLDMMRENCAVMNDGKPLSEAELCAVEKIRGILRDKNVISCTACRYCTDGCPMNIAIPDLFACMNAKKIFNNWNTGYYYTNIHTKNGGRASDCIECGACEGICPQHLEVRKLLKDVAAEFEA
jgi:predicted aldo/keto reductase-like oxidoreductase